MKTIAVFKESPLIRVPRISITGSKYFLSVPLLNNGLIEFETTKEHLTAYAESECSISDLYYNSPEMLRLYNKSIDIYYYLTFENGDILSKEMENKEVNPEFLEIFSSKIKIQEADAKVFSRFNRGFTSGLFISYCSNDARALIKKFKIDSFEDLKLCIFYPVIKRISKKEIDLYFKRKNSAKTIHYLHPFLKDILAPTKGLIFYREQVENIMKKCALFSNEDAIDARKNIGKKHLEKLMQAKTKFREGCLNNPLFRTSINAKSDIHKIIDKIWNLISNSFLFYEVYAQKMAKCNYNMMYRRVYEN